MPTDHPLSSSIGFLVFGLGMGMGMGLAFQPPPEKQDTETGCDCNAWKGHGQDAQEQNRKRNCVDWRLPSARTGFSPCVNKLGAIFGEMLRRTTWHHYKTNGHQHRVDQKHNGDAH